MNSILKEKGNNEIKKHNYSQAVNFYSEAIKINETDHIYYSNRSAAYYNLDEFEKANEDAKIALKLNPEFLKAHYRNAACLYELDNLIEAKEVIEKSKKYGDYSEMDKLLIKIEKEYQLVSIFS